MVRFTQGSPEDFSTHRIKAATDGVFVIVMTVLVPYVLLVAKDSNNVSMSTGYVA